MQEKVQYKKSDFYYDLPEERIAQTPAEPRDSSRLLVYDRKNKTITDKVFRDIADYLQAGDVLVVNLSGLELVSITGARSKLTPTAFSSRPVISPA